MVRGGYLVAFIAFFTYVSAPCFAESALPSLRQSHPNRLSRAWCHTEGCKKRAKYADKDGKGLIAPRGRPLGPRECRTKQVHSADSII
jgi:hypothetical protein